MFHSLGTDENEAKQVATNKYRIGDDMPDKY